MTFDPKDIRYLPEDTQFREDVRAALTAIVTSETAEKPLHPSQYVMLAITFAEQIEKQLKEKGRI